MPVGQGPSVPALAAGAQPTAGLLEAVKSTVLHVLSREESPQGCSGRGLHGAASEPRVQTRSRRSYLSDAGALYNLAAQVSRRRRPRCLL